MMFLMPAKRSCYLKKTLCQIKRKTTNVSVEAVPQKRGLYSLRFAYGKVKGEREKIMNCLEKKGG